MPQKDKTHLKKRFNFSKRCNYYFKNCSITFHSIFYPVLGNDGKAWNTCEPIEKKKAIVNIIHSLKSEKYILLSYWYLQQSEP